MPGRNHRFKHRYSVLDLLEFGASPVGRLEFSLGIVLAVLGLGTLGYRIIEDQPWMNCLYMTVITLTTVGFKEVFELSPQGQVLTMLVVLVGYAAVSVAVANLVSMVVGGELRAIRGSVRMKSRIAALQDHIVVCGHGRMGSQIVRQLMMEQIPCVAIDQHIDEGAEQRGILHIVGDATEDGVLEHAAISKARALVSCLSSDADNVFVTLSARGLNPDLKILARAEQASTEPKLIRAGADSVISPQSIGANKIVGLLCRPHVSELVELASEGVDLEVSQYIVDEGSSLIGRRLRDSGLREKGGMTVVAIKRADRTQVFSPDPDEIIHEHDALIVLGEGGLSDRLLELTL